MMDYSYLNQSSFDPAVGGGPPGATMPMSAPAPPSFYGDLSCSAAAMNGTAVDANGNGNPPNGNGGMMGSAGGYNRYHSSAASAAAMRTAYSMAQGAAAVAAGGVMGRGPADLGRTNAMFNPTSLNLNGEF
jgi:hypothetical protein